MAGGAAITESLLKIRAFAVGLCGSLETVEQSGPHLIEV
jgi:hypothetical protein